MRARIIGLVVLLACCAWGKAAKHTKAPANVTALGTITNGTFEFGTNGWSIYSPSSSVFSVSDLVPPGITGKSLRYQNSVASSNLNFCFSQPIRFKGDVYYKLSFCYKGDGQLAPMVLVTELGHKGVPRKMFRLSATQEWQTYAVEFCMGKNTEVFRVEFYPGSAPNSYVRDNGTPNAGRTGEFYFADITLIETTRRNAETPTGPYQVKTEEFIFKETDTVKLNGYVDVPVGCLGPYPVMVYIHGGGWSTGDPKDMAWSSKFLTERGVAGVRLQYRLIKDGGTFPKTISDVMDGIEWVRQNAKKYNFDLSRFGLRGGSAGGHLSSIAAQRTPECNVYMGFCGLYDAYEIGEGRFARKAAGFIGTEAADRQNASAIYQIKTPPPATILFHGMADPTIDYQQAVRFAAALQKKGAHVELVLNEGCGHEVGNPELVNRKMIAFLNQEWKLHMPYEPGASK